MSKEMHPAEQFLKALDPFSTKFLFVTFDDKGSSKHLTRTLYGSFEEHRTQLNFLNKNGAGIYVTVNKTLGNRRKKEDIVATRAVWQEDDAKGSRLPDLPPSIVVQSSIGHFHRYWLTSLSIEPPQLDVIDPLGEWEAAQRAMVDNFDSDPNARDISRVLRVPGFINHKYDEPFFVQLISVLEADRYTWPQIREMTGISASEEPDAASDPDEPSTLMRIIQQIQSGEHIHGPIRTMMLLNANKGFDIEYNRLQCTGFINLCPDAAKRSKALADLEGMLRATYTKIAGEIGGIVSPSELCAKKPTITDIDFPPGLMGELAAAANDFFVIPNKTVAIMTSLSLIAGIIGRRYNISASGLNLYTTVMMPTGAGKDSMRKFCQQVLMHESLLGTNGMSFLGPQNFTSPKALITELVNKPSMLSVMTEAGLLYKTESGDRVGLTRTILQAYTSSGALECISPERYSDEKQSLPYLYAPALTILNEATPVTLLSELKKRESINTGELPRMWIFMLTGKREYSNPTPHQLILPSGVSSRLKELLNECILVQNSERPKVVNLPIPDDFQEYNRWCTDKYNELIDTNPSKAIMYTRAAHKVLKTTAIIQVFNNDPDLDGQVATWAKDLFEYEMANIDPILTSGSDIDESLKMAMSVIDKILNNSYQGKSRFVSPKLTAKGIFTESAFKQAAESVAAIKNVGTSSRYGNPQSGAMVTLRYMANEGYIEKIGKGPGHLNSVQYKITNLFRSMYNAED